MNFIKNNFLYLIVGVLILSVLLLTCNKCGPAKPIKSTTSDTSVSFQKTDTTYKDTTIYIPHYVPMVKYTTAASKERLEQPSIKADTSYKGLLKQYESLKDSFYSYHGYYDSIVLDGGNNGYIEINDLVSENKIQSRTPVSHLRFPTVHDTVIQRITTNTTYTEQPKRQVYLGAEITGSKIQPVNGINAGLLYKDRKDRIYSLKGGVLDIGNTIVPQVGVGVYFKIKLHK